jgi:hypothetical protein
VAHARQAKLAPLEFLELLLQDEIERRNSRGLQQRLAIGAFEEEVPPEAIIWDTLVSGAHRYGWATIFLAADGALCVQSRLGKNRHGSPGYPRIMKMGYALRALGARERRLILVLRVRE